MRGPRRKSEKSLGETTAVTSALTRQDYIREAVALVVISKTLAGASIGPGDERSRRVHSAHGTLLFESAQRLYTFFAFIFFVLSTRGRAITLFLLV